MISERNELPRQVPEERLPQNPIFNNMANKKYRGMRSRKNEEMFINSTINQMDLRSDIAEWIETSSREDISFCSILTVVQRPGSLDWQLLPQEYKSQSAARVEGAQFLSKIILSCGGRFFSSEIRNDRFYVTTDNNVKITMVFE